MRGAEDSDLSHGRRDHRRQRIHRATTRAPVSVRHRGEVRLPGHGHVTYSAKWRSTARRWSRQAARDVRCGRRLVYGVTPPNAGHARDRHVGGGWEADAVADAGPGVG
jgi:hypothetical protein